MEILKMITDHDQPETVNMVFGPEIPIPLEDTKRPLSFYLEPELFEDVRSEVDEYVKDYMSITGCKDYQTAMSAVFEKHPSLKKRYAES